MKPSIGRIVLFHSQDDDGIISPAIVLRTRKTTIGEVIEDWPPAPFGTTMRPAALVADLPDDVTVDLLVHGLGFDRREYCVPFAEVPTAGHWSWPPRA